MQSYLKTNVELMCILAKEPSYPSMFSYSTFLSLKEKEYITSDNNEEACASEIVFVRYVFAFLYYLDAYSHIKFVHASI